MTVRCVADLPPPPFPGRRFAAEKILLKKFNIPGLTVRRPMIHYWRV